LNGAWQADFTVGAGGFKKEQIMVQQIGDNIIATKITGDEYVPAGKVTVRATYTQNPFEAEQVCASEGYTDPSWNQITITVLDSRHFKVEGGCSGNVTWERLGNPTLALDSAVLFDSDDYRLKAASAGPLLRIQSFLKQLHPGARLLIGGYTDDIGTDRYNMLLSQQRAESVAHWLLQHGVQAANLDVKGFGKADPRYPNTNEEARSRNRRVEIEVLD